MISLSLTGDLSIYTTFDTPLFFIGQCLSGKNHCEMRTVKIFGTTVKKKAKRSNNIISETSNFPVINLYMYICALPRTRLQHFSRSWWEFSLIFISAWPSRYRWGESVCPIYDVWQRVLNYLQRTRLSCGRMIQLLAHPLLSSSVRKLSISLSMSFYLSPVELSDGIRGVRRGRARIQITRPRESLALYK